ncbi:hypothetical protein [Rhizobium grahamii]|uniref:hypothetical protein n=1 Tax=Rhizobium grahamii TaxID=1120045 RepID=UPI0034E0AB6A
MPTESDQPANCNSGSKPSYAETLDHFEFARTIAFARDLMAPCYLRLSAGRMRMCVEMQALCFFSGANPVLVGSVILASLRCRSEKPSDDASSVRLPDNAQGTAGGAAGCVDVPSSVAASNSEAGYGPPLKTA